MFTLSSIRQQLIKPKKDLFDSILPSLVLARQSQPQRNCGSNDRQNPESPSFPSKLDRK